MPQLSDHALVLATLGGDKHAFGQLADRYQQRAYRMALRMVGDADLAQEMVQETLLPPITFAQAAIARLALPPDTVFPAASLAPVESATTPTLLLVPRVIAVFKLADTIREEANAVQITTPHVLLAILREGAGMAVTLLQDLGVDLAALEQQLVAML